MRDKKWLTLNSHGRKCLKSYLTALSGTDLMTSELDYLNKKGLTDFKSRFRGLKGRNPIATEALTDLGVHTADHYFPGLREHH
jgi:hypothetical protein